MIVLLIDPNSHVELQFLTQITIHLSQRLKDLISIAFSSLHVVLPALVIS